MNNKHTLFVVLAALCALGSVVGAFSPASAQRSEMPMLGQLAEGHWELRPRDGSGAQHICIGRDRRALIQVRHPDLPCSRVVLEDGPNSVTVQYTCRGHGYGRTHIRRETSQLIQLDTQGIADGLPFELNAEGRRIGDCGV